MSTPVRAIISLVLFTVLIGAVAWKLFFSKTPAGTFDFQRSTCEKIPDVSPRPFGEAIAKGESGIVQSGLFLLFHDRTSDKWIPLMGKDVWAVELSTEERPAAIVTPHKSIRIFQTARYVADGIVEVELQITNLSEQMFAAKYQPPEPRGLATSGASTGWNLRLENGSTDATAFKLPPKETTRLRYYLMSLPQADALDYVEKFEKSIPPFGRIDENNIREDVRTVEVSGWVLDNRGVTDAELWVGETKISVVKLDQGRSDVCAIYPGYKMCIGTMSKVGFKTTYPRPTEPGCPNSVTIRARDTDGNLRIVARKSISPVAR